MASAPFARSISSQDKHPTKRSLTSAWIMAAAVICALCLFSAPAHATLSLGTVTLAGGGSPFTCPGTGWYSYTASGGVTTPMQCLSGILSNCSGAQTLNFTFGSMNPAGFGISPANKGIVVFFSGDDGTTPSTPATNNEEVAFADYYFKNGFTVVQVAWSSAWEAIDDPFPLPPPPVWGNIQLAACRQATFLNYVKTAIFQPIQGLNPLAGMCAQGVSAGAAAIAYGLAYYGSYLDYAEMLSGPTVSDIKQGCKVPAASNITVCGSNSAECRPTTAQWSNTPQYSDHINGVRSWTNDYTCVTSVGTTTPDANARWLRMSIVDDGTNSPVYNYPNTHIAGWLCASVQNQSLCDSSHPLNCMNNSSAQGQIFLSEVNSNYLLYEVDSCHGPEGVGGGQVPFLGNESGHDAVQNDMRTNCANIH